MFQRERRTLAKIAGDNAEDAMVIANTVALALAAGKNGITRTEAPNASAEELKQGITNVFEF